MGAYEQERFSTSLYLARSVDLSEIIPLFLLASLTFLNGQDVVTLTCVVFLSYLYRRTPGLL